MLIAGFPSGLLAANCYVIAAGPDRSCVIIDPGEAALEPVRATVAEHRLTPAAALLTHGHLDHAASLREIAEAFDVPGFVHPADDYMLDDPLSALSPELQEMLAGYPVPALRPDDVRALADGVLLEFDGFELTVDPTPGHTGGSVLFRLAAHENRPEVIFTGDTLFAGSVGRTDLPGGSADELSASLQRLMGGAQDDAVVLPGHGPQSTIGVQRRTNPFLFAAERPGGLAGTIRG